jgi:hypothetical protein
MLTDEEINKQIQQFLTDNKITDNERIVFLAGTIDMVRKKMALEIEESLDDKDVEEIEKMTGSDDEVSVFMIHKWEQKTGKSSEQRVKEIIKELYQKFLEEKDKPES